MGGLDQGRSVTFSPLSLLFYGILYRCKWECNSTQNAPYLSWLGIQHVLSPMVWVPTLPFMLLPIPSHRHIVYVSAVVKALSAHLQFVVEFCSSQQLSSLFILIPSLSGIVPQYALPFYRTEDSSPKLSTPCCCLRSWLVRPV